MPRENETVASNSVGEVISLVLFLAERGLTFPERHGSVYVVASRWREEGRRLGHYFLLPEDWLSFNTFRSIRDGTDYSNSFDFLISSSTRPRNSS